MKHVLEIESTLTDRYQTTVPEAVRRALHLSKRDKLRYRIQPDGTILLSRAESTDENDPALSGFLNFLAQDLATRPHAVRALDAALQERLQSLIGTVEVDLDAPLLDDE
jgi:antitoxin PrlF